MDIASLAPIRKNLERGRSRKMRGQQTGLSLCCFEESEFKTEKIEMPLWSEEIGILRS
jgi:hypothetical protein